MALKENKGPKTNQERSKNDQKTTQKKAKTTQKKAKTTLKRLKNDPKTTLKRTENDPKIALKRTKIDLTKGNARAHDYSLSIKIHLNNIQREESKKFTGNAEKERTKE